MPRSRNIADPSATNPNTEKAKYIAPPLRGAVTPTGVAPGAADAVPGTVALASVGVPAAGAAATGGLMKIGPVQEMAINENATASNVA